MIAAVSNTKFFDYYLKNTEDEGVNKIDFISFLCMLSGFIIIS